MKNLLLLIVLLLSACAAPPTAKVGEPDFDGSTLAASGQEIWAYHASWMGDAWRIYDLAAFRRILFFDLIAGKDGRIEKRNGWPEQWQDLRASARSARVAVDPVVTVLGKEVFAALFASREARARLLEEVVSLARASGGVHLDVEVYERVGESEAAGFRDFLEQLRRELDRAPRRLLTAFVPTGAGLYGKAELALLDAVVAQGYDFHWRNSASAGPVAVLQEQSPVAWRSAARTLTGLGVPPRKILFSTPLYGYEWPTESGDARAATRGPASVITYAPLPSSLLPDLRINALSRAAEHGLRRESGTGAPWYAFHDGDGWRQGWFDDPASLRPRLDFVRENDFRGVALFVLGYDGGVLLDAVRSGLKAGNAGATGTSRAASP